MMLSSILGNNVTAWWYLGLIAVFHLKLLLGLTKSTMPKHWDNLKERFTKGNHFQFSGLLKEMNSFKQDVRYVTNLFTYLKTLWDEL